MQTEQGGFQVADMDRAIRFYTQKLSFKLDFRGVNEEEKEEYAFVSYGNARLELILDMINGYCDKKAVLSAFLYGDRGYGKGHAGIEREEHKKNKGTTEDRR